MTLKELNELLYDDGQSLEMEVVIEIAPGKFFVPEDVDFKYDRYQVVIQAAPE